MPDVPTVEYVAVAGMEMYAERRGRGGTPVVVVHGGFGVTSIFGALLDHLSERRQVVAVELQGHGHTRDIDRPFSYEAFGDDLAQAIDKLGLGRADLLGYSLGAGACLRCALQHPDRVRRLAVVSFPCRRGGWFPEVLAAFDQMSSAGFEAMRHSPMYEAWSAVAPDRDSFRALMDKTGDLQRRPYDWSEEVTHLESPTLLVYGDADSISPSHAAEFYALLGGGLKDPGWDGSSRAAAELAILPATTHYDIFGTPRLGAVVADFFD